MMAYIVLIKYISTALGHAFVAPMDAERYVEELTRISLHEFGGKKWVLQHERLEKLNLQAHHCAQNNLDNFVVDYLVTYGKVEILVENLLMIEAWKEFALPLIKDDTLSTSSMRIYFMVRVGTVMVRVKA